ncbi:MAG: CvpA family protein [Acidiferrobacterales bacterium]|nr:CvpA family protein [Acidiferrobacterales bacterium]
MSPVDIAIIVVILVSALIGIFRGFIREILSLASWLVALYVAYTFAAQGAVYLEPYISQKELRGIASFAAIFVCTLILVSIVSYVIYRLFALAGITGLDRSLGGLFGLVRGAVVVALLILAATFMDFAPHPWYQSSKLVIYFAPLTEFILSLLPPGVAENFPLRFPGSEPITG